MPNKILKFVQIFNVITLLVVLGIINILFGKIQNDPIVNHHTLSLKLKSFIPKGWEIFDTVLHFIPENLYEQINGRAEYYLAFDVVDMTFVSYEKKGEDLISINLSIFNMGTPTHAFGVFSGERSPNSQELQLGRDAYRSGANYYIWKGQYYIRIIASDTSREITRVGLELAQKVTKILNDTKEPVWGLDILPKKNQVPQSVQYFLVDALGLDFLHNTYIAKYMVKQEKISIFISQQYSPDQGRETLTKYLNHAKRYGKQIKLSTIQDVELLICDMGKSYDVLFQKGKLIGGVFDVKNKKLAIEGAIGLWKQLEME